MTKTSLDVTSEALQMIGILAVDEAASAEDHARTKEHLEAIYAELDETYGVAPEWTIETVPVRLWKPLAMMVAGDICTAYGREQYTGLRPAGMSRFMRAEFNGEVRRPTQAQYF